MGNKLIYNENETYKNNRNTSNRKRRKNNALNNLMQKHSHNSSSAAHKNWIVANNGRGVTPISQSVNGTQSHVSRRAA